MTMRSLPQGVADFSDPDPLPTPVSAQPEDRDAILETVNFVHRISRDRDPKIATEWPHVYDRRNLENVLMIKEAGKVVSSVGIWPNDIQMGTARLRVGGINATSTLPGSRGQGLGMRVMKGAHERMRQLGCQIGLLGTGIPNWYRKLDWEQAGEERSYRFDRGNIGLLPALARGSEIEQAGPEARDEILALYQTHQYGGIRSRGSFQQLLSSRPGIGNFILARKAREPLAYLRVRGPVVIEWAGATGAVAGLVRAWFDQLDDPGPSTSARDANFKPLALADVLVVAPGSSHPFVELLENLRIPCSTTYAGMIYLLDPQGILEAFGHTDISVDGEEGRFTLDRGGQSESLDLKALTKLFFGPEQVSPFGPDVFPLPLWQWRLERV